MKLPDVSDPHVRLRLAEQAAELVSELPSDDGEALTVLAYLLAAKADACGELHLAVDLTRAAAQELYWRTRREGVAPAPELPRPRPRRPSARRKA